MTQALAKRGPIETLIDKHAADLALWAPTEEGRNEQMFRRTLMMELKGLDFGIKKMGLPGLVLHEPSFVLAVAQISATGLRLGRQYGEACLLPFWNKDAAAHELSPCIQIGGYKRVVSELYPVSETVSKVVYTEDEWEYWEDETGSHYRHRPAGGGQMLQAIKGALNLDVLKAAYCRVMFLGDRKPITGILGQDALLEKLKANKNAMQLYGKSGKGQGNAWATSGIGMTEKTIAKYTLSKCIPLWGEPLAAMHRDGLAEAGARRELAAALQETAVERNVPDSSVKAFEEATKEIEDAVEVEPPHAAESDEYQEMMKRGVGW